MALQHASEELQMDKDLIVEAVCESTICHSRAFWSAEEYATAGFKTQVDLVLHSVFVFAKFVPYCEVRLRPALTSRT